MSTETALRPMALSFSSSARKWKTLPSAPGSATTSGGAVIAAAGVLDAPTTADSESGDDAEDPNFSKNLPKQAGHEGGSTYM